ncbi:MAG: iron-containing alcohol dehydrogenase, partial [Clostridiales bacterium]|nr:iron-containing alcohol dehydrogenase [Clostridiales bacterium]
MQKFTYHSPTEIIFGRGAEEKTAEAIQNYGGHRVLLVYGGGSVVRSGLLERLTTNLAAAGLTCEHFGGAKANPALEHAREGV